MAGSMRRIIVVLVIALMALLTSASVALAGSWSDVPDSLLASYGVSEAQVKAISSGYPDGTFQPFRGISRAQFVKMAGAAFDVAPLAPLAPTFADVPATHFYYRYVEGAHAHNLVNGVSPDLFGPDRIVTRQQAIVIIARAVAAQWGFDLAGMTTGEVSAALAPFRESSSIAGDLRDEMAYAIVKGITKGSAGGELLPHAEIGRLAAATLLVRAGSVAPIAPTVTTWPTASAITLGKALSTSTLTGGAASVPGTFAFTAPSTVPAATGAYSASVTFTPTDTAHYTTVSGTVSVLVNAATTNISGVTVTAIAAQTYTGSAITPKPVVTYGGTTLALGVNYSLSYANNVNVGTATVTLTGLGSYTGTKAVTFQIIKATPSVSTWPTASAISLGKALSTSKLTGGAASVPGAFAFASPSTIPAVAGVYSASVTFTPTDTAHYNTAPGTVKVTVNATGGAPTIANVVPATGPAVGGNTVTISGTNLAGATAVTFGTASATILTAAANKLTVTAPAGTKGTTVDVTVTAGGGTAKLLSTVNAYRYSNAQSSLALKFTGKDGVVQTLGTWTYDPKAMTFKNTGGVEATFVKSFTGANVVRYSGTDAGNFPRMAVMTKGILLSDLVAYAGNATGITLSDAATVKYAEGASGQTYTLGQLNNRYYYPSFVTGSTFDEATKVAVPTAFAIQSYNVRNEALSGQGWASDPYLTRLNGGTVVPTATDSTSLEHCFSILTQAVDDDRSLRALLGQKSSSPAETNLGSMSWYLVDNITFSPVYFDIATTVTSPGDGGTATVTTDDGFTKASEGEPVTFTISGITAGYELAGVTATDAAAAAVTLSKTGDTYSFTMPASKVTIAVTLSQVGIPGAPTIANVVPGTGPAAGGNTVTITGTNLADATSVSFGANAASIVSKSDTQVIVTAPAGNKGAAVAVSVTNPKGTSTLSSASTVRAYRYSNAQSSFALKFTDKAGVAQTLGTWTYDPVDRTLEGAGGTEASFVTSYPAGGYVHYSGLSGNEAGSSTWQWKNLGTVTKGVLLSDLATYATGLTGIPLDDDTNVSVAEGTLQGHGQTYTLGYLSDDDRYYYPSWILDQGFVEGSRLPAPTILAIGSYTITTLLDTTGLRDPYLMRLNGGQGLPQPATQAKVDDCFNLLDQAADDYYSLRLMMGQRSSTPDDYNLSTGAGWLNANIVTFTPAYLAITARVTSPDGNSGTATVAMDDGYPKAAPGEAVSFTISGITSGYKLGTVAVSDGASNPVTFTKTGDTYSFTMPATAVTVAVTVMPAVPVTGVTLEPETATLDPGGTDQLTATVAPDDATNPAVTWSSSNESVATVDASGLVTALAGGSATITVTTTDGGFTDTCLVTVSVPFVPPVLSSLDAETVTTTTGGNTIPGPTYQAGPTLGGNQVILTGTGFTGATQVYFGTTAATSFTVDSDTQITAVAPAGTEGTVEVSVLGSDGTTVSNTVPYRYALWQISGVVRGRWVTELDEDLNPVLNPESGGALAGAFVYVTINALDPLYDAVNLDNNKVTFFDGTTWVDRAVTAADGTYTFSTASFRGKPLPIGTIVDVVALHDLSTYTSGFYAPDPDEWHNNKSVLQYGIYDRPNTLVNFRNYTSTLGPDGLTLGNRVLPWDDGGIPAMPNEFLTPNVFTDIS